MENLTEGAHFDKDAQGFRRIVAHGDEWMHSRLIHEGVEQRVRVEVWVLKHTKCRNSLSAKILAGVPEGGQGKNTIQNQLWFKPGASFIAVWLAAKFLEKYTLFVHPLRYTPPWETHPFL